MEQTAQTLLLHAIYKSLPEDQRSRINTILYQIHNQHGDAGIKQAALQAVRIGEIGHEE